MSFALVYHKDTEGAEPIFLVLSGDQASTVLCVSVSHVDGAVAEGIDFWIAGKRYEKLVSHG
jgi:hypothetical protein